jgi:hypothetical protein
VFIFRKKILVDLFLQEEGPKTLGDFSTPQEETNNFQIRISNLGVLFQVFMCRKF